MFKHDEPKKRSWRRLILLVIPAIMLLVSVSYFAVNNWYNENLQALSDQQAEDVVVVIGQGSSIRDIGDQLKDLGVIRNSTVFSWYVGRQGDEVSLQAGTYRLNPTMDIEAIVAAIGSGEVATNLFTIIPGKRLDEVRDSFIDFGFTADEVDQALRTSYDSPLLADLPTGATLEGYIFPETYQIAIDSTAEDILAQSFDELYSRITPEHMAALDDLGFTLHEAVTLASIVELESADVSDQKTIAQVFHKRLREGMVLGSDPTFFYAAAITGQTASTDLDHPYNTRIYGGLPPGPISNFNFSAFDAVAFPADTEYLFFVSGDDGITRFNTTFEDHQRDADQFCIELCRLPE